MNWIILQLRETWTVLVSHLYLSMYVYIYIYIHTDTSYWIILYPVRVDYIHIYYDHIWWLLPLSHKMIIIIIISYHIISSLKYMVLQPTSATFPEAPRRLTRAPCSCHFAVQADVEALGDLSKPWNLSIPWCGISMFWHYDIVISYDISRYVKSKYKKLQYYI